jgi:hypothetical protein
MTTDVTPELAEAIQRGHDQRDRANMASTIAYFQALLAEHSDHPVLVYEVGGAYDTADQEETARGYYYERALPSASTATSCAGACASTPAP